MISKAEQRLRNCIKKQYENKVNSYEFTYWQEKKNKAAAAYEKTLSEDKQLAIFLFNKVHMINPHELNPWIKESPDYLHDWDGEVHKKYLKKAKRLLKKMDFSKLKKILKIVLDKP